MIDAEHDLAGDASRHEVVAHHASLAFFSARAEHTLELGGAVFAAAEAGPLARLRAVPAIVGARAVRGELEEARRAFDATMPEALDHLDDLPEAAGELALGWCLAEILAGELDQAEALAVSVYDAAVAEDSNEFVPTWALIRGRVALGRGRVAVGTTLAARGGRRTRGA